MKSIIIFLTLTLVLINLNSSGNRTAICPAESNHETVSDSESTLLPENQIRQTIINIRSGPAADCDSDFGTTFISGKMINLQGII